MMQHWVDHIATVQSVASVPLYHKALILHLIRYPSGSTYLLLQSLIDNFIAL